MWSSVAKEEWNADCASFNLPIFYDLNYLSAVGSAYGIKLHLNRYLSKGKTMAILAFFSDSGQRIVAPEDFSFTAFYVQKDVSERLYFEIHQSLLVWLKKEFSRIYFKLPITHTDVRPFIWSDFKVMPKYTHIKTQNNGVDSSVKKNLKKVADLDYVFVVQEVTSIEIELNIAFLKTLALPANKCDGLVRLLNLWNNLGCLKTFNVYKGKRLLSANIVLLDYRCETIYTLLLNNVPREDKYAHTFLYQSAINWGFANGFAAVDFCGANMAGISLFKSSFNTTLTPYYKVSYRPMYALLAKAEKLLFNIAYPIKNALTNLLHAGKRN